MGLTQDIETFFQHPIAFDIYDLLLDYRSYNSVDIWQLTLELHAEK